MDQDVSAEGRASPDQPDAAPPPRGLKIAVIVMGIVLIIGFATVFITIAYRVANPRAEAPDAAAPYETKVTIPADAEIVATEIREGQVLVTVRDAEDRYMVIVLDADKGTALGRFVLAPE